MKPWDCRRKKRRALRCARSRSSAMKPAWPTPLIRLRAMRARRDKTKWESAIRAVEDAARSDQNLMPHIIHAVEGYCTVGEISDALRRVFGEYQETVVI